MRRRLTAAGLIGAISAAAGSLPPGAMAQAPGQAAVRDIHYELRFDAQTAAGRGLEVTMSFATAGPEPVRLSFPAWTPGAYEISNFARNVGEFTATQAGRPLRWDKTDPDTWRVRPSGPGPVRVSFAFLADSLDNAMAWAQRDFLLVNGTNVFPYPEGIGLDFPATVTVRTERGWRVATGMRPTGPATWGERSYHDLVDMPFFIGRFDLDSVMVGTTPFRLASYPAGAFTGPARRRLLDQLRAFVPAEAAVFGGMPWEDYSVLLIFDRTTGGGSALEHQNSHVGIYAPEFMGTPTLASISAHEIFHAWNVKRVRPVDLVPYRYDAPQPTEWLWVSEGITDYYADLALVRGGVVDSTAFLELLDGKLAETEAAPPVALEDASLSTWVHPRDGSGYLYYPKGALAGFLLDIMIRHASDNRRSLDDVMRSLYQTAWNQGRGPGFTGETWWAAVREAAGATGTGGLRGPNGPNGPDPGGGDAFGEFARRFIDGRDPFPWAELLPRAGLRLTADTTREARIGVQTSTDSAGRVLVVGVAPGSSAGLAGIEPGDLLTRVGEIAVAGDEWPIRFRARYGRETEGTPLTYLVLREGREVRLPGRLRFETTVTRHFVPDPGATPKAARIRHGLLGGG